MPDVDATIEDMDEEFAARLIMKAREHWFAEEQSEQAAE